MAGIDIFAEQESRKLGLISQNPLSGGISLHCRGPIDLRHNEVQSLSKVIKGVATGFLKVDIHGSPQDLMPALNLGEALMGFAWTNEQLDALIRGPFSDSCRGPGRVSIGASTCNT